MWKNKYMGFIRKSTNTYKWHSDAFKLAQKIGATLFSTPFSVRGLKLLKNIKFNCIRLHHLKTQTLI